MTGHDIPGLEQYRQEVVERRRLREDYVAAALLPGCTGLPDFLDRLEGIVRTDPRRAHSLYFRWRKGVG